MSRSSRAGTGGFGRATGGGVTLAAGGGTLFAAGGRTIFTVGSGTIIAAGGGTIFFAGGGTYFAEGGSRLMIPGPPLRGTKISLLIICNGCVFCNRMLFQEGRKTIGVIRFSRFSRFKVLYYLSHTQSYRV